MERIEQYFHLQTPCFILDKKELIGSIRGFRDALNRHFAQSAIGYSVKTNSLPRSLSLAAHEGILAEVVSADEFELAKRCGFPLERIIYNGPMKSKDTFLEAVRGGSVVNIETKRELNWLKDLPMDKKYPVGIRLNINISHISPEDAGCEDDNSRFGFSDETLEFRDAIAFIQGLDNVVLAGLHIHRTAHSRSVHFYKNLIEFACSVIEKYSLRLAYLDVGGGYYGIFPDKPTFQDYSDAFFEVLKSHALDHLCLIVEPGNALVASCFSFLSEVIDTKEVSKELWFATIDGSRNDIDPLFKKNNYLYTVLYPDKKRENVSRQVISGCTCLEFDRLFTLEDNLQLKIGDRLLFRNVGAYTMCLTPLFIRYFPMVYMETEDNYEIIRERWTEHEFIQKTSI